jgi:hypothetical protein
VLDTLASKYDSQSAFLGAQDVRYVEAGNNEAKFANQVGSFLQEIEADSLGYKELQSNNQPLMDKFTSLDAQLKQQAIDVGWTADDVRKHAPEQTAVGELNYDTYVKAGAVLADATKTYVNKMDGTAAAYNQAWTKTKKNQYTAEVWGSVTAAIDVLTSLGIGGNAVTQFAMKEFKEVKGSFDRITNAYALRGGQVGDMIQAAVMAGFTVKNFSGKNDAAVLGELQGNTDSAGTHVKSLADRFNQWSIKLQELRDHAGYEGIVGGLL